MLAIRAAPMFALALAGALALAAPAYADATADLFAAAKGGTASEVRAALSAGADPGARDEHGATPLHLAARHNPAASVIVTLIEGGADPHAHGEFAGKLGMMPLPEAVDEFSVLLLEFFAGSMPLHLAAMYNPAASVVTALIEGSADPGARNEGGATPLHLAVMYNPAPSVITALIEGGADPGARPKFDMTPLHVAEGEDLTASVLESAMIAAFAGMTPLHLAAMNNSAPSVITALIEGGADPDARNEFDFTFTASHATAEENLAASVMVSMIGAMIAVTPLHMAAWHNENPSVITALIEGGADPGARDEWGKTPFDYAEDNEALRGTEAYWRLNDGRFE